MKKIVLLSIAVLLSSTTHAQVKVIDVIHEADTLLTTMLQAGSIELYKNKEGYLIKVESSNIFDVTPSFFLGKDEQESIESLECLDELCNNDVATKVVITDAKGVTFVGRTAYASHLSYQRKPTYIKSDAICLKNEDMAGVIEIWQRHIESLKKTIIKQQ